MYQLSLVWNFKIQTSLLFVFHCVVFINIACNKGNLKRFEKYKAKNKMFNHSILSCALSEGCHLNSSQLTEWKGSHSSAGLYRWWSLSCSCWFMFTSQNYVCYSFQNCTALLSSFRNPMWAKPQSARWD